MDATLWVSDDNDAELLLRLTSDYLVLDRPVDGGWERVRNAPLRDVTSIDVDAITVETARRAWKNSMHTRGVVGKGSAVTGVLVVFRDGEHLLLRVVGKSVIEVRAVLGPMMSVPGRDEAP